jgi:tRNA dimethylallyltransferase
LSQSLYFFFANIVVMDELEEETDIFVLAGVTAAGKTSAALAWAERGDAEILSCDSLLFYHGMDIGSAKPSREERARVPHHGIDLVPVDEPYDVGAYLAYADKVVRDVKERGKRVLVVGGSGFYLQAFFAPVVDDVKVEQYLRDQVREWNETEGMEGLLRRLHELNPEGLAGVDVDNPIRVNRALERCLASGKTLLALQQSFAAMSFPFRDHRKVTWVLDREPEDLEERIRFRTASMLANGLDQEVKALRERGLENNPSASRAVGYRETLLFLDGELSRDEWKEAIVAATLRLARKQRKWFGSRLTADRAILLSKDMVAEGFSAPWEPETLTERA